MILPSKDISVLEPQAWEGAGVLFVSLELVDAAAGVAALGRIVSRVHHDEVEARRVVGGQDWDSAATDTREFGDVEIDKVLSSQLLVDIILFLAGVVFGSFAFGVVVAEGDGVGDLFRHEDVHEFGDRLFELAVLIVDLGVVAGQNDERRAVLPDATLDEFLDGLLQRIDTLRVCELHYAEFASCVKMEFLGEVWRDSRQRGLCEGGHGEKKQSNDDTRFGVVQNQVTPVTSENCACN